MGMKPRKQPTKKPTPTKVIGHDHPCVEDLCLMAANIAEDPGELSEGIAWVLAMVIERCVPQGDWDAVFDNLRNEIMVKTCLLTNNEEAKRRLWGWVNEGRTNEMATQAIVDKVLN